MLGADKPVPELDSGALADLMAAVAHDRNQEAFACLFDHFAPRVNAYVRRLGASPPAAEDLVQDVMLTVWRQADLYDPSKAGVATWIFTIARNRRIDLIRRERRPELDSNDPSLVPDRQPEADTVIEQKQRSARLRSALATLPETQCYLLELAYFESMPQGLIADELGLPLSTVKSRIHRAMKMLKCQLGKLE